MVDPPGPPFVVTVAGHRRACSTCKNWEPLERVAGWGNCPRLLETLSFEFDPAVEAQALGDQAVKAIATPARGFTCSKWAAKS